VVLAPRQKRLLSLVVFAVLLGNTTERANAEFAYQVKDGDTLWTIARRHGCDANFVARANKMKDTVIYPGARLTIPKCSTQSEPMAAFDKNSRRTALTIDGQVRTHVITAGETLMAIANRYNVPVDDLKRQNQIVGSRIIAGKTLVVDPGTGEELLVPVIGQSIGHPFAGRLTDGVLLPPGPGYFRRRPDYAWGAQHTVYLLREAIAAVSTRYPTIHRLAIGDLSARTGGRIPRHSSHQTGRDVDLGFFYRQKPAIYPQDFVRLTEQNIHFPATWLLLEALAETADRDGGVERIFLSYSTQRLLYRKALKHGVPQQTLETIFQYPYGPHAARGLVRHEPNHDDHFHVRFKCPLGDNRCY
jgi:LysM repeat protein